MNIGEFLTELHHRNPIFYFFGWFCLLSFLACLLFLFFIQTKVLGINPMIKPIKFFLSSWILGWTLGWLGYSLKDEGIMEAYSWMTIIVLNFENIYIFIQAYRGQLSHFNVSTPFNGAMFALMGLAIVLFTSWTAYIGFLFWIRTFPELNDYYLWAIRLGFFFFVIFAFEGGLMGARLSHTVGAMDGGKGLPLVNWSTRNGDLRVAHFLGMHALQILPLISFYAIKNTKATIIVALVYFLLVSLLLLQALMGRPLIRL